VSDDGVAPAATPRLPSVPRDARAFQGEHAGVVTRSMAGAADALAIVVLAFALMAGWSAARFLAHPARFSFPRPSLFVDGLVGCGIAFLYFTAAWGTSGRTPGAQLLGLRVVDRDGGRVRWGVAALRSALCVVLPAGLLWTVVSKQNLSVQDILLRTTVVYDWRPQTLQGPARDLTDQTRQGRLNVASPEQKDP
jgi:uncharacterized RDD family membrane protein YckC